MRRIFYLGVIVLSALFVSPDALYAGQRPENGTVKETYGSGSLRSIVKYKNGEVVRRRLYDDSGQLMSDKIYRNERVIVMKTYYLNGQLKSVWSQKSGVARFYYPTGSHKITIPVKNPSQLD